MKALATVLRTVFCGFVVVAALAPSTGWAASATATFNVTATVLTQCSVSASDLAFGNYDAASAVDTVATSNISVTCSLLTPYTISLNHGSNAVGSTRRMSSGTSRLTYEIYRDATWTNIFGAVAQSLGVSGIGTGFAAITPIYGKIAKNQAVSPGSYADQITVTIDY